LEKFTTIHVAILVKLHYRKIPLKKVFAIDFIPAAKRGDNASMWLSFRSFLVLSRQFSLVRAITSPHVLILLQGLARDDTQKSQAARKVLVKSIATGRSSICDERFQTLSRSL
jgi:hypothetical protein